MPFRSTKQRTYLKIHHPGVYAKFKREHGTKIVRSGHRRSKKK